MHAFRAGRAFDGDRVLPDGALVLVDGDRIVSVAPATTAVPDGVAVTELPGTTLLPGLVDSHVHLCGDGGPAALDRLHELDNAALDAIVVTSLRRQLAAGVTTVRDLGDARYAVVDRHRRHGWGPRVVASGPPVTTPGGHCWPMGGQAAGPRALRAAVAERAERGVDVVKVMASGGMMTPGTDVTVPQYPLEDLRLLVEAAHAAGLPITAHAHAVTAVELCLDAGVDGIEHCSCLGPGGFVLPEALARRLAGSAVPVCPTLGQAPGAAPPPRVQATLDRLGISLEAFVGHVGRLRAAGVRLVGGSDAGIGAEKPHGVLPWGVVDLVAAGMGPAAALAAVTGQAADLVGLGAVTGRLRPGLAADLLLVAGDPTRRVEDLAVPRLVVCRGEQVVPDAGGGRVG